MSKSRCFSGDIIKFAQQIIKYPYNRFNLDNYRDILSKEFKNILFNSTKNNNPIKLMSGQHKNAGIITYKNDSKANLIGKGVLYDAGGYNLKHDMSGMNGDMAGMAVALATAKITNTTAICPIATNLIHNNGILPGDILSIGKKDVEISNTDAEGRLVLAEAITELNASNKDIIITIATLTGCAVYAVGEAVALLSPNNKLAEKYLTISKEVGSATWRLPLWEKYQKKYYNKKLIKNSIREFKAGTIEGGMFIKQFVPYPDNWIHLDIAAIEKKKDIELLIKTLVKFVNTIK